MQRLGAGLREVRPGSPFLGKALDFSFYPSDPTYQLKTSFSVSQLPFVKWADISGRKWPKIWTDLSEFLSPLAFGLICLYFFLVFQTYLKYYL